DLINETVGAYTADKAYNVAYYIEKFMVDSGFEIGTNEISTLSRKLQWDSTDETSLARVLSVATQFDAELDFSFEISGTNVVKRYINIYKHRGDDNQVRLYLDKDINNIVTTGDIYDLYTSVIASGGTPEGVDKPINLKGYKWTDPDGRYTLGTDGILRDTVAVRLWSRIKSNDNPNPEAHHLQRVKSYEATTQATLLQSALSGLKKAANPAVNYEIDIAVMPDNIAVGDTVHIVDDNEDLYLSARVLELKYDYVLEQYSATLGDYLIEQSTVNKKIQELADSLKNMPKVVQYYPWVRYADDADGNGFSMFPQDKAYMAIVFGKVSTPSDNPSDYAGKWQKTLGNDGQDGIEGPKGADGKTTYFHRAYANSSDGKTNFSITDPTGKAYLGTYNDFVKADSTDPTKYLWQLVKGDKGSDGLPGKDGIGIKSTQIMYAQSTSGTTAPTTGWTAQVPTLIKGQYLWTQTTWVYTDNTGESGYTVSYNAKDGNNGSDGIAGKDGVGISATKVEYVGSTSGTNKPTSGWLTTVPSVAAGSFLWTKTTWSYTDGTSESGYSVAKMGEKGDKGDTGVGVAGTPGKDGRTPYVHTAWSRSSDGVNGFSNSYPGENLISVRDWNTKPVLQSNGVPYMDIQLEPNTAYTLTTNISQTAVYLDVFFFKDDETPSSGINGVNSGSGRTLITSSTGNVKVGLRYHSLSDGTNWIKLEKGSTATPWYPSPTDDPINAYPSYRGEYTDYTQADSDDPTKYEWVLIRGPKGDPGPKGVPGSKDVPMTYVQATQPTGPIVKNSTWWVGATMAEVSAMKRWDGSSWVNDTIAQAVLNIKELNAITINGSTINSPNISVPFNNVTANPDEPADSPYAQLVSGTTKLTSNLEISANLTDGTNKTPQWVKTLVSPQGFSNIISTPDASKPLYQTDISFGSIFLSEWHSDVTANDGFVSSYFRAGDAATYERKDTINDTANFKNAVVRYSRKGTQVNVGFSFMLLSDTGWVGLSAIPKGYTPASLASVGITCPSLSYSGYSCVVYPNGDGWRLIPSVGQGKGGFQGSVSYVTYDDYPYNDAK
ncbi:phage tail spike protein, partial [Lapidilactobacillus bayanensis]|uniref:phage tail spike protein n=1 Tax=Lapidilactobacillus bayanensis TaxID=2485998 RepID=UPI000F76AAF2